MYKYCIVPKCTNTSIKTPEKLFFNVPKDSKHRTKWYSVVKRDDKPPPSTQATRHCCEDHFDVEKDMDNYVKFKLVGGNLRLKKGVLPNKFECHRPGFHKRKDIKNFERVLCKDIGHEDLSSHSIEEVKCENQDSNIIENNDPLSMPEEMDVSSKINEEFENTQVVQRFIEEIEKRPAIWNSDSPDYSDRALKVKCWQEIVHLFQDREDMKVLEKKQLGDSLQRKWKGIRGCFTRELNRQKSLKTGAVGPRKSEYIYFQQLQFLKNVVTIKEPGLEEEDGEEERDLCIAQISTKRTAVDDETEEYLYNRPNRSKRPKINEDRLFLLSLVGSLNKIPEEIKMGTKIKIMQLLDEAIQGGDDNQHQQPIVYRNTHSYSDSD